MRNVVKKTSKLIQTYFEGRNLDYAAEERNFYESVSSSKGTISKNLNRSSSRIIANAGLSNIVLLGSIAISYVTSNPMYMLGAIFSEPVRWSLLYIDRSERKKKQEHHSETVKKIRRYNRDTSRERRPSDDEER